MRRNEIRYFRDIPNVGAIIEKKFFSLGITRPAELIGKDPYKMYKDLCETTHIKQDPCVLDVFISAVRYMEGGPARKWWEYTEERKGYLDV